MGNQRDTEEAGLTLRELVETPHMAWLWHKGDARLIRPVLIEQVFGDGLQLFGFTTINSRPNYYVIQGDSRWSDDWMLDGYGGGFGDHVDEVYDAIENEWGPSHCGECLERYGQRDDGADPCTACEDATPDEGEFPSLDWEGGCSWWAYDPLAR